MEKNKDNNNDHTAFSIYKNKAIFINESMYFDPDLVCISNAYKGLVKEIVLTSGTINDRVEKRKITQHFDHNQDSPASQMRRI